MEDATYHVGWQIFTAAKRHGGYSYSSGRRGKYDYYFMGADPMNIFDFDCEFEMQLGDDPDLWRAKLLQNRPLSESRPRRLALSHQVPENENNPHFCFQAAIFVWYHGAQFRVRRMVEKNNRSIPEEELAKMPFARSTRYYYDGRQCTDFARIYERRITLQHMRRLYAESGRIPEGLNECAKTALSRNKEDNMGKYDRVGFANPKECHKWYGFASPRGYFRGTTMMPKARVYMDFTSITKDLMMETPHVHHAVDEYIVLTGADMHDFFDFGAEVDMWLGDDPENMEIVHD
jgi:hypothetical protein